MLSILYSTPIILLLSVLFGVTVKIADLLDEHGLKWFRGSAIVFGIIWGVIGGLLILSNNIVAHFYLATLLHWVFRYRIDYSNHGVAGSIMLLVFLWNLPNFDMNWLVFLMIFIPNTLFGSINDYFDRHKEKIKSALVKIIEYRFDVFLFPLILMVINVSYWIIFVSATLSVAFYMLTKHYGMQIIEKQKRLAVTKIYN